MDRDSVLAWIPHDKATSAEEAVKNLSNHLFDAAIATFQEQDYPYEVIYRDQPRQALWHPYTQTKITFTTEGYDCGVGWEFFPDQISDELAIPSFVMPNANGYRFWVGHENRYPKLDIGCKGATPDQTISIAAAISRELDEGVFFYLSPRTTNDHSERTPPMILDHGQPLLFLTPRS